MVENVGRKVLLVGVLALAAILMLVIPDRPVRLGLDLAGGTRLVYQLDIKTAREKGIVLPSESDDQIVQEQIAIMRNRADPNGIREPILRKVGSNRIEISLASGAEGRSGAVRSSLANPMDATSAATIALPGDAALGLFPGGGGVVSVGREKIRYGLRVENELRELERGLEDTPPVEHQPGELVLLISDDSIKNAIENLGNLRFMAVADDNDFARLGADSISANAKLREWLGKPENAALPVAVYNALAADQGGPVKGVEWFPMRQVQGAAPLARAQRYWLPLMTPPPEWTFTGADLERVGRSSDETGYPCVTFEMRAESRIRFGDFTAKYVQRQVAIVLNDEVASAPNIEEPLRGSAQIKGHFTEAEVNELVTVLRSGSLKIRPTLVSSERVGATVGDQYVTQGWQMGLLALGLIIGFMCFYYRWLGAFASVGLVYNMLLLLASLVALQATLTLPGIAGIILGIGMAVDANILIFERIREEQDLGRKPVQAAKAGFENALSAIVDSNVTTVLSGLILYNVGTGPIRGFAVTLIIGVLTSMFASLVVVKLLIHWHLQRGVERWKMLRWLANPNFAIVAKTRYAITISAVLILAGLALFAWLPARKKYGTDFLGGATVKVRTEQPLPIEQIRGLVEQIPGEIGESAEVVALPAAEVSKGRFTEFRISFKTDPNAATEAEGGEMSFKTEIHNALEPVLQKGPIEVVLDTSQAVPQAKIDLYFEEDHAATDVAALLAGTGLIDPKVEQRGERGDVFSVTSAVPAGLDATAIESKVVLAYLDKKDPAGREYRFAEPLPESTVIGSQVVGELRDSAIKALILSMFLTVIYIRVRFAEYSWGIAAIIALVHDILFTIGAVSFLVWIPFVHVEFDMALIAVFLTIIGYSINDTIVTFDRIRENLPRMKGTLDEIVNRSINQTLSRTIITSGSVATIGVVLVFNIGTGNVLEAFSFTMLFGIVTGTFSSIYIAAPIFVWLEKRALRKKDGQDPRIGQGHPIRVAESAR